MLKTKSLACSALFLTLFATLTGCLSVFPAATTDWGHGARPMEKGHVAIAVSAGGGAGIGGTVTGKLIPVPIGFGVFGFGASGVIEGQITNKSTLRLELGAGRQFPGPLGKASATVVGAYGGMQVSLDPQFALRVRVGGGAEFVQDVRAGGGYNSPFGAIDIGGVYSLFSEGALDAYVEGHVGLKGAFVQFAPVFAPSFGGSLGLNYEIFKSNQLYAGLHSDVIFNGFLSPTGNVQIGYRHVF
jgi:hypothetical protein